MEIKTPVPNLDPARPLPVLPPTPVPAAVSARPVEPTSQTAGAKPEPRRDSVAALPMQLIARDLRVELDQQAGLFVRTLIDPTSGETVAQFPNEARLAFARGVNRMWAQSVNLKI